MNLQAFLMCWILLCPTVDAEHEYLMQSTHLLIDIFKILHFTNKLHHIYNNAVKHI